MYKMVLGVNGSPRKDGITSDLLMEALVAVQSEKVDTAIINLTVHAMPFYNHTGQIPKDVGIMFNLLRMADGIIFATPVQWYGVSDLMTIFINYLTLLEEKENFALEGKVVAFIAVCEEDGGAMAISKMALSLNQMGCLVPPYCMLFHNKNMADKSEHNWQNRDVALLGKNVARACALNKKVSWGY